MHQMTFLWILVTHQSRLDNTIVKVKQLDVVFLKTNYSLWIAGKGLPVSPLQAYEQVLLNTPSSEKIVNRLEDLEGAVYISNSAAALRYVRLRTSPSTWFMWSTPFCLEFTDAKQYLQLPNYGMNTYTSTRSRESRDGYMGRLSDTAFRSGNFSTANVRVVKGGFVITRWLLSGLRNRLQVQLVKEEVGFTGSYRCTIVQTKEPPNLPGTHWQIPTFE